MEGESVSVGGEEDEDMEVEEEDEEDEPVRVADMVRNLCSKPPY